jgi:hypothetical protein
VGPRELGEVICGREEKRRDRLALWREFREGTGTIEEVPPARCTSQDIESELEELLPPDEAKDVKAALGSLELENAVQELLERNRRALIRLEELQRQRLIADGGGSSTAAEGSEEWDTGSFKLHASFSEHFQFTVLLFYSTGNTRFACGACIFATTRSPTRSGSGR